MFYKLLGSLEIIDEIKSTCLWFAYLKCFPVIFFYVLKHALWSNIVRSWKSKFLVDTNGRKVEISMFYPRRQQYNNKLYVRNEGKLKSYESCNDLRAWSHDDSRRDLYLREWMKSDMPFCIMPICMLAGLLGAMTCRNRSKASPRCHPDCKSKIVLDSICTSCHAMKECFKNEEHFEKYFIEEELETSHWPCERCLEALKSIKMLWKVIVEKIFNVNLRNDRELFEETQCCRIHSTRKVAKNWQNDIVSEALAVKRLGSKSRLSSTCACKQYESDPNHPVNSFKIESPCKLLKLKRNDGFGLALSHKSSNENITMIPKCKGDNTSALECKNTQTTNNWCKTYKTRVTIADHVSYTNDEKLHKKCRCTSVKVMDMGCDPFNTETKAAELKANKINLEYLQNNYDLQKDELKSLKRQNSSLKIQLQNMGRNCKWKSAICHPVADLPNEDSVATVLKPFECIMNESTCLTPAKDVDSEMIITMKNGKSKSFRYISLLQVLHKTNKQVPVEIDFRGPCFKKEDPVHVLAKVQKILGAMVRREISLASGKMEFGKESDINATFQKLNASRSVPSCLTSLACYNGCTHVTAQ